MGFVMRCWGECQGAGRTLSSCRPSNPSPHAALPHALPLLLLCCILCLSCLSCPCLLVAGSGWVSGAIYTQAEYDAAVARIEAAKSEEQRYLDNLRANETLPVGGTWLGALPANCAQPWPQPGPVS